MEYQDILYEKKGNVAVITLNKPDKLNVITNTTAREIMDALLEADKDDDVRAIIITGSGRAFCAGIDVSEFVELMKERFKFYKGRRRWLEVYRFTNEVENTLKPTIAAVNGYALGGGFELALACDIIIASENAQFGFPEVTLGGTPGAGGMQRLGRLVGKNKVKELVFTGKRITAEEGYRMGFVNKVVKPEELMDEAYSLAESIAKNAPIAVMLAKIAINKGLEIPLDIGLSYDSDLNFLLYFTEDREEGLRAFREKRKPEFKGR